jgi:Asp-tRNA(Asn)/Glu-tRNA(Gln) amidotransferase B subunit
VLVSLSWIQLFSTAIFSGLKSEFKSNGKTFPVAIELLTLLLSLINEVIEKYPDKVKEYQSGKKGLIGLFIGEVMKLSKGKADPKLTNELIRKKLD